MQEHMGKHSIKYRYQNIHIMMKNVFSHGFRSWFPFCTLSLLLVWTTSNMSCQTKFQPYYNEYLHIGLNILIVIWGKSLTRHILHDSYWQKTSNTECWILFREQANIFSCCSSPTLPYFHLIPTTTCAKASFLMIRVLKEKQTKLTNIGKLTNLYVV